MSDETMTTEELSSLYEGLDDVGKARLTEKARTLSERSERRQESRAEAVPAPPVEEAPAPVEAEVPTGPDADGAAVPAEAPAEG